MSHHEEEGSRHGYDAELVAEELPMSGDCPSCKETRREARDFKMTLMRQSAAEKAALEAEYRGHFVSELMGMWEAALYDDKCAPAHSDIKTALRVLELSFNGTELGIMR